MRDKYRDGSFEQYIALNHLEEKNVPLKKLAKLSDNKTVSVAFDGNMILDDITAAVRRDEPMASFTNSTPLSVYSTVYTYKELLASLKNAVEGSDRGAFRHVLVFNGCGARAELDASSKAPMLPIDLLDYRSDDRNSSVPCMPKDVIAKYANRFHIDSDLEGYIVREFQRECGNTFRPPHLAWSQISAYCARRSQSVSEVYGSLTLLAFPGIDRVITDIDSEAKTFSCVSKAAVLTALRKQYGRFTEEDFTNILLMSHPSRMLLQQGLQLPSFDALCSASGASRTEAALAAAGQQSPFLRSQHQRSMAALDAPVLTNEGKLTLLSAYYEQPKRTADIGSIFGRPLSVVLYYLLMSGPLLSTPFSVVSQDLFVDDWPLNDSPLYRFCAEKMLPLRLHVVFQLNCLLSNLPTLDVLQMLWMRQYNLHRGPAKDTRVCPIMNPPIIQLASWNLHVAPLPPEGERVYFSDVVQFSQCATSQELCFNTINATVASTLLRSIDLLGYFIHDGDHDCSEPSIFTGALACFTCNTLTEYGVIFIELVRCFAIHDRAIEGYKQAYPMGLRLAARVMSIVHINPATVWDGPFDTEMAAFGCISRQMAFILRQLTEVNAAQMVVKLLTDVPLEQFSSIIDQLPFGLPLECHAGFLISYVLARPQDTLEDIASAFPCLPYLTEDLVTLFSFWGMAYEAFQVLSQEPALAINLADLEAANALVLNAYRRLLPDVFREYTHGA